MKLLSILEDNTVSKRFLFPRAKGFQNPLIVHTPHGDLSCFRQLNHPGKKMLMVFHGTSEVVADYLEGFASQIDQMGFNLFLAEYPGYSMSTGLPSLVNIADSIPYYIRHCGVEPGDLVIFGRSLGSVYAVNAVSLYPSVSGLILESGIADFYERIDRRVSPEDIEVTEEKLKNEVGKYFDIESKLKQFKGHTLIMHTQHDRVIDVRHAIQNHEWVNGPKKILLFEDGDHSDIQYFNREAYFDAIRELMENC